jgi:hypothetical protein
LDTGERVSTAAAQAIADLQAGRKPKWVVNAEVYSSSGLRGKIG